MRMQNKNDIARTSREYETRAATLRRDGGVDYEKRVTMPIRDMARDGEIAFCVDVYGVDPEDLCLIPGGARPMYRAVTRMGLDPFRYRAEIWDVPVKAMRSAYLDGERKTKRAAEMERLRAERKR